MTEDDYLEGSPELIVEVAASSANYDIHDKHKAYARNGVREYLVYLAYEQQAVWFSLQEGVYEPLAPDISRFVVRCSGVITGQSHGRPRHLTNRPPISRTRYFPQMRDWEIKRFNLPIFQSPNYRPTPTLPPNAADISS